MFSRLAHSGVERAVGLLATSTGIDTYVNATEAELGMKLDVENELTERGLVSIHIGFLGGLDGYTVLAFSPESAERLADALMPGIDATDVDGEFAENSLKEVANIMLGGSIDGWADYLDTTADITTPTYVDNENGGPLDCVDAEGFENSGDDEHVLVFRNQLETTDGTIKFDLYMMPIASSIGIIVEISDDDGALSVESLATFPETTNNGATRASKDIAAITGTDMTVEMSRLSFIPIESVSMSLTDTVRCDVVLELSGTPGGYIVTLLDESSTENITSSFLLSMEGSETMRQSAIQEIGNITTSDFLDGWTNTSETTIDISSPKHVHDTGSTIIDLFATDPTQPQEYAFFIDSTIQTDDGELTCDIYTLPDKTELREAPRQLSLAA